MSDFLPALSHAVLAGTGIYCLYQIRNANLVCPFVSYGLIVVNNVLGICVTTSSLNLRVDDAFKFTAFCQLLFVLPCINTQVWLQNGYQKEISWMWALVPVVPLVCYLANVNLDIALVDLIIIANLIGMGFVSVTKEITMGAAATVTYAIIHFFMKNEVVYNFGLCFFAYFSLGALGFE